MGKKIYENISFGEYVYFKYRFYPKSVNENSFKSKKSSIEEPSCFTSVSKEEEGTKGEDSSKPYVCSIFMSLFGFS